MHWRALSNISLAVLLAATALAVSPAWCDEPAPPWIGQPLTASPQDIALRAKAIPQAEDDVEVLYQHVSLDFDETGRMRRSFHRVWRCTSESAVDSEGFVEAPWAPWYQRKPTIEARIISTTGEEHRIDPALFVELTPQQLGEPTLSDRKLLRGPLPALAVGAIVEQWIVVEEQRPFLGTGTVVELPLGLFETIRQTKYTASAPGALAVRCAVRGLDQQPVRTESDGRVQYVLELKSLVMPEFESHLPPDLPQWPTLVVSTGKSWQDVARGYAEIAERQFDLGGLESIAKQSIPAGADREQTALLLTAKVQQMVRYTAIAFGESAVVPFKPQQTLARRFGDCKDQSTLLAALLRSAGHPAYLALLRVSGRGDVPVDFPGLGRFDHCIVYVPGEPPLWIDPTFTSGRGLELPPSDQGRLALVVCPDTTQLVLTPQAPASANRYVHRRELRVGTGGKGKLVETIEPTGSIESDIREYYSSLTAKEFREIWTDYAKNSYQAQRLTRLEHSDPRDRSQPLRVELEIDDAQLAGASDEEIAVALDLSEVLDRMPYDWLIAPDEANAETPADAAAASGDEAANEQAKPPAAKPRQADFVLSDRHTQELHVRVVPPAGFALRELPKDENWSWGTAKLSLDFDAAEGGEVTIVARWNTGSGRYTTAEQARMQKDFAALPRLSSGDWGLTLHFDHLGLRLTNEQKYREAFAEFEQRLAEQPDDALMRIYYAQGLVAAGLGDAAREQAKRAAELAPQSAEVQLGLGFVLAHDRIGRYLRTGSDVAGSLAAYERAWQLDPKNATAARSAAILAEHDQYGYRYATPEGVRKAIDLYRAAMVVVPEDNSLVVNLCAVLCQAGEFAEVKKLAESIADEQMQSTFLAAAVAVTDGLPATRAAVARWKVEPDDRRQWLLTTAAHLERARRYELAGHFAEAAVAGVADQERGLSTARSVGRARPFEDSQLPADNPARVVQDLVGEVAAYGALPAVVRPYADGQCLYDPTLSRLDGYLYRAREASRNSDVPPVRRRDGLGLAEFSSEGDEATGWRVTIKELFARPSRLFVIRRGGGNRVVLAGVQCGECGRIALEHLAAGRTESARQWLEWARAESPPGLALIGSRASTPFVKLWALLDRNKPEDLKVLAAALQTESLVTPDTIEILKAARDNSPSAPVARQLDWALVGGLSRFGRKAEVLEPLDRLLVHQPADVELNKIKLALHSSLGQFDEAWAILERLKRSRPQDGSIAIMEADLAGESGDYATADRLLGEILKKNPEDAWALNTVAWNKLFFENRSEEDAAKMLEHSQAAVRADGTPAHDDLHTLASVQAELNDPIQAMFTLRDAVTASANGEPDHVDWYVVARVAEHYGLPDEARRLYRLVEDEKSSKNDTYELAQRRLRKLDTDAARPQEKQSQPSP
jgi:tetratricopeptide (TPR) repeat protein